MVGPWSQVLSSSPGLDVTMAPGGSTGHVDWLGSHGSLTLQHHYGPSWQPRPLALAWLLMVSGDIGCGKAMDSGPGHHRGTLWQCRPLRSIWPHGLSGSTGLGDTKMATGGSLAFP